MKLSVITINKNNAKGLEKTIKSVVNQTFNDFEYIVIDGASTDGSIEIIKKYQDKISHWISEPDKGIYNAMNKGIKLARGEYLLFLNSGDKFYDNNVLENVFKHQFDQDIVYGNISLDEKKIVIPPSKLTLKYFFTRTLPHQSTFIKRKLFYEIGFYNEDLKIVSDWKFFLDALILHSFSYKKIDVLIAVYYSDGISSKQRQLIGKERHKILKSYFPRIYDDYIQCIEDQRNLRLYRNSRIVQAVLKIMGFFKGKKHLPS